MNAPTRAELEPVYRRTDCIVRLPDGELTLAIGTRDAAAEARLAEAAGCRRNWVILTPCNPRSQRVGEAQNEAALARLHADLHVWGGAWFSTVNRDRTGHWPDEPGVLLVDPDPAWAEGLGRRFEQNALIGAALGEPPALIWLID